MTAPNQPDEEIFARQVAAIAVVNSSPTHIARELNVSRMAVRRIMQKQIYKDIIADIGSEMTGLAVAKARKQLAGLVDEAIRALHEQLKNNNMEAVKIVFRGLGVDEQEQKANDTNLTVILPGAKNEQVIEGTQYAIQNTEDTD